MADHSVLRLTDLPVEVLSTIFSMVRSVDKVVLAQVCQRFNSVLQRREVIWSVDFQRAYELDAKQTYSFLKDKTRCTLITSVNLTGCYWLSSTTIRQFLTRLENLETMLVADTKLTNSNLKFLLSKLPKVKNLAISWNGPVDIGRKLEGLRYICVYVPDRKKISSTEICNFLRLCKRLEEISIVTESLSQGDHSLYCDQLLHQKEGLPHLRSFLLTVQKGVVEKFYKSFSISHFNKSRFVTHRGWELFFIPTDLKSFSEQALAIIYVKQKFGSNESKLDRPYIAGIPYRERGLPLLDDSVLQSLLKIRSLSVFCSHKDMDVAISSMFRKECQLEELNIYGWYDEMVLSFCKSMPASLASDRLRKLCIPICAIWRKNLPPPTSSYTVFQGLCKRQRVSRLTANESREVTPFQNLVQSCPNIEEFFMVDTDLHRGLFVAPLPDSFVWDIQQLTHIAKWKKLRELTLGGFPVTSFKFLDEIGQCCQMLKSLTLNYLHLKGSAVSMVELVKALPLFTKLEDLTIRQPKGHSVLHALHQKTLRRVVLLCDKVSGPECSQFLENCTNVVFLYIMCDISKAEIRRIKTPIQKRFAQRQALVFHIAQPGRISSYEGSERQQAASCNAMILSGIHPNEILLREVSIGVPEDC